MEETSATHKNELFDNKLRLLKLQFRRHMNGVAASLYRAATDAYKTNYGISLQHLRDIANSSSLTPEECDLLWRMAGREVMLIAILSIPSEALTPQRLTQWAATAPTSELIEVMAFDRTGRMPSIHPLCNALILSSTGRCVELALHTAARGVQNSAQDATDATQQLLLLMKDKHQWTSPEANATSLLCRMAIRRHFAPDMIDELCRHAKAIGSDAARRFLYDVETERLAFG